MCHGARWGIPYDHHLANNNEAQIHLTRGTKMSNLTIAIISDIHGNRWALEAVLRDIAQRGIQQIVNLGDSLLGPLDPAGTANLLIDLNIPSIRGNDDRVLLSPPTEPSATLAYVRELLTPAHMEWLHTLPATAVVADDLFLCHGDPSSDETYLLEEISASGVFLRSTQAITASVTGVEQSVILCGHSHFPRTIFLPQGKLIVNPGSIGVPAYTADVPWPHAMESGCPHAKYVILSSVSDTWRIEHVLVPYDWEQAANIARSHHRLDWAIWLASGRAEW
jgi:predicted phosphodiesterase